MGSHLQEVRYLSPAVVLTDTKVGRIQSVVVEEGLVVVVLVFLWLLENDLVVLVERVFFLVEVVVGSEVHQGVSEISVLVGPKSLTAERVLPPTIV